MSIPTSLIVVLLVVAWLVVLVPMVAKRRDKVPRAQSGGSGFRILRRAQASLKRRPRRASKASPDAGAEPAPDASTAVQRSRTDQERTLVKVGAPAAEEPRDAAEEWAAAHTAYRPAPPPPPVDPGNDDSWVSPEHAPEGLWNDAEQATIESQPVPAPIGEPVANFPRESAPRIPAEIDEQEWAEHTAAAAAPTQRPGVDDEALRPTPRRRGRGGYDPEAAEATRAYRYRQRRRVTMVLAAATVLFTLAAVLLASWLWVGAAISGVLLVLYLTYLRRQVKIEAQIRQRRMERLQRARQIRPEYGRGRAPARPGRPMVPGRTVVDLDDDDPSFDDLEPYDPPVTYRRAAGQ